MLNLQKDFCILHIRYKIKRRKLANERHQHNEQIGILTYPAKADTNLYQIWLTIHSPSLTVHTCACFENIKMMMCKSQPTYYWHPHVFNLLHSECYVLCGFIVHITSGLQLLCNLFPLILFQQVLCNGPGTCIPVCLMAFLLRVSKAPCWYMSYYPPQDHMYTQNRSLDNMLVKCPLSSYKWPRPFIKHVFLTIINVCYHTHWMVKSIL